MTNTNPTSNRWAITLHRSALPQWTWPEKLPDGISFMCGQIEKCPSTGSEHYQMFVKTVERVRRGGVAKLLGTSDKAHIEKAIQPDNVNIAYCSKLDTRYQSCPTLQPSLVKETPIHPIDWLLKPRLQLCYITYSEASDCGEAMSIVLENPSRFSNSRFLDYRKYRSEHSHNCCCMEKYEKKSL